MNKMITYYTLCIAMDLVVCIYICICICLYLCAVFLRCYRVFRRMKIYISIDALSLDAMQLKSAETTKSNQ